MNQDHQSSSEESEKDSDEPDFGGDPSGEERGRSYKRNSPSPGLGVRRKGWLKSRKEKESKAERKKARKGKEEETPPAETGGAESSEPKAKKVKEEKTAEQSNFD